jgi:hypothetical protein
VKLLHHNATVSKEFYRFHPHVARTLNQIVGRVWSSMMRANVTSDAILLKADT